MVVSVYPWQQTVWQQLIAQQQAGRLPHALLFTGQRGIGKGYFADALAHWLLCAEPTDDGACGDCKSCQLIAAGTHPDWLRLEPEAEGKAIKIDPIRAVNAFVAQTAQQGGYKVVQLSPADALNTNAANALLKSLEEPTAKTVFLLLSDQPGRVMATIRSRCNQVTMTLPERQAATAWLGQQLDDTTQLETLLTLAGGAPLQALALSDSAVVEQRETMLSDIQSLQSPAQAIAVAERWQHFAPLTTLDSYMLWLSDLVRWQTTGQEAVLRDRQLTPWYQKMAAQFPLDDLYLYIDRLTQYRGILLAGNNPNKQLLWEEILLGWCDLVETGKRKQRSGA